MKKWIRENRSLSVVLFGILIIICILFFPKSYVINFLFYEEDPVKVDVIILLSGDSFRMEKAAELYNEGYADKVLLTNALAKGSTMEYAESLGIPRDALLTENEATSTYENALYSKNILLKQGFDSAIVVTSNYHMRRSKLAYERVFQDTNISFTYVPYHHDDITRDSWDENKTLFKREYRKLIGGYFLFHDGFLEPLREKLEEDEMEEI